MTVSWNDVKLFWDYIEFYPDEDEEGFDGIHYGGIKGIKDSAPNEAKRLFDSFEKIYEKNDEKGIRL